MSYQRLDDVTPSVSDTYWFISAPGEPTRQDVLVRLREKLTMRSSNSGNSLCELYAFNLPDFKVGTLDQLVVLSDDLAKVDSYLEGAVAKLSDGLKALLKNDIDQWRQELTVGEKTVDNYLRSFQWNSMKYRTDKSLRELSDALHQEAVQIDNLMKSKMAAYQATKTQLTGIQRKQSGNLSTRSLNGVVQKDQMVLDSEYLTTVFVAVPKQLYNSWWETYETIAQMVVPRSSTLIAEDDEFGLFSVILFQKVVEEFSTRCRQAKFVVREFRWDDELIAREQKEAKELAASERELWVQVVRLCKINFGEMFACWAHVKILRLCVESILRYGLPPNFQPIILKPSKKADGKLRDLLSEHFARLARSGGALANSSSAGAGSGSNLDHQIDESIQGVLGDFGNVYPYVFYEIKWSTATK